MLSDLFLNHLLWVLGFWAIKCWVILVLSDLLLSHLLILLLFLSFYFYTRFFFMVLFLSFFSRLGSFVFWFVMLLSDICFFLLLVFSASFSFKLPACLKVQKSEFFKLNFLWLCQLFMGCVRHFRSIPGASSQYYPKMEQGWKGTRPAPCSTPASETVASATKTTVAAYYICHRKAQSQQFPVSYLLPWNCLMLAWIWSNDDR